MKLKNTFIRFYDIENEFNKQIINTKIKMFRSFFTQEITGASLPESEVLMTTNTQILTQNTNTHEKRQKFKLI